MTEKNQTEKATLYLVATPIGNLSDLSPRAVKVLSEVDFIAAEDTRNSLKLLTFFSVRRPLVSYHEHNRAERGPEIVSRLLFGESCALITDAGMPAVSDPGEDLVRLAAEAGVPVRCVPGCCAAVTALALSGLPTGRFVFEGFLPSDRSDRRARLAALCAEERTTILYEAPHRLKRTLAELSEALGERPLALCRELTKLNEEVIRTTLGGAVSLYETQEPRGEYVLILGGATPTPAKDPLSALSPEEHVRYYEAGGLSRMDAIKAAARDRKIPKSALYNSLQKKKEHD